ncbi:MAG: hypothetical protein ACR2JV_02660 [Gaiellales bacterium]
MATRTRPRDTPKDDQDTVETPPRRGRGVLAAILAASALVIVTALVTAIAVDAVHGRANPVVQAASGASNQQDAIDKARAQGYKDGVRDTKQQAKDQLGARYDQGYAKGYAKGRSDTQSSNGQAGGYADGFNAGVTAAVDAYQKIIAQAQQIIADANQSPVTTAPQPTMTTG